MKKKFIYALITVLSLTMFFPKDVFAEVKVDSLKETIDEEIETFGAEESYKEYVDVLKSADLSNYEESDDKVNVYMFRGSTCSHCLDAVAHFASIVGEEGKYFNLKTYEVWNNSDNSDLMNDVAKELGDEASGVPYIVIGDKSWSGYASSMDDELLSKIKSEYKKSKSKRYDIIKVVNGEATGNKKSSSNDVLAVVLIILITGAIVFGIVMARKKTN